MIRYDGLPVEIASGNAAVDKELVEVLQAIQADAEVMAKLERAESAEEIYSCIQKYTPITLEDFRRGYEIADSEGMGIGSELSDEELDAAVGGRTFKMVGTLMGKAFRLFREIF